MKFADLHCELHVTDLEAARRFYVDQLELPVLQETPSMKLLAVLAGRSRLSIFGDRSDNSLPGPDQVILAVNDIGQTIPNLTARGVAVSGRLIAAGTFLKFVTTTDPDGNIIAFSEYLHSPVAAI